MQKVSGGFHTPLQQLFLLEERFRLAGVHLPDAGGRELRLHGIKCVINALDCVIDMGVVAEVIEDSRKVTAIPGAAAWIEGVMNYRGTLVPVYRPREFLAPADAGSRAAGALLVLRKDRRGNEFTAIRVDRVIGMQKFGRDELLPCAGEVPATDALAAFADAVVSAEGRRWYRLDTGRLLGAMNGESPRRQ